MKLIPIACLLIASASPLFAQAPAEKTPPVQSPNDKAWIERSNSYTQLLLDIQKKHSPEAASAQGLSEYDTQIGKPTLADEDARRKEMEAVVVKIQAGEKTETNKYVLEDLTILDNRIHLGFRQQDYARAHEVPFLNASSYVFQGLRPLLDDQTAANRRPAAVVRLRKYTGLEPGYTPLVDLLKQRDIEQMAKPGVIYPAKTEVVTELSRNSNYVEGIALLFKKYNQTGWEEPYAKLKTQLADYDAWVRATILPKARTDFRLPPEEYALNLEAFGVDIPPVQLATMAHAAFTEYQGEMQAIAAQIAKQRNLPSSDYRDVIAALKKEQITGDAILPLYEQRLKDIEGIIVAHNIVTLPSRPAIIRIASAAESSQQPAPHMEPPPFLNNTGQRGVFVLPLNLPPTAGSTTAAKIDDFTFDAAAWTLTAHEARPGHELQFDSMVEHGTSRARVLYAFNSTNVEGWGLYSEYLIKPYMPLEGQLISLQLRLQRAARAFMDPELQSGKIQPADAMRIMTHDVVLSEPFAQTEVERYTFRSPGQANSYFYGYTKLLQLRKDTEAALGAKFDQKKFHDFILLQGLLPPDLMRKAVMEDFVPSQK
jgi:hypothetical protein